MLFDWLIFAGSFLSLAGTGTRCWTRSYVIQSVVDDTTEEEINMGIILPQYTEHVH